MPRAAVTARRFLSCYRAIGLLPLLTLCVTALAALVHHHSSLPTAYTWLEPLRTLKDVVSEQNFIAAIVAIFLLGRLRLRGGWRFDLAFDGARLRRNALVRMAFGACVIAADVALFEHHTWLDALGLMIAALVLPLPESSQRRRVVGEVIVAAVVFLLICYAFTIFKALVLVDRSLWDARIIALERSVFGVEPHRYFAALGARSPSLSAWCDWVYFHFFPHMALVNVLLVGMRASRERIEYLGALAICYILGGPLYWLFPGVGPSYHEPQLFRFLMDVPNGLTLPVRGWLDGNTQAVLMGKAQVVRTWGYVACMPSLHIAQEVVMLWYARRSRLALAISILFTGLTVLAVMLLGWHYPTDVVAGCAVAALAVWMAHRWRGSLLPERVMPAEDQAVPPRPQWGELLAGLRRLAGARVE
ncbi:MAG: phosphatase PAP2 family protein [Polyangiaceae bacterium]|nr:phosphatase PAP2 family protein [Myxococcales bacterium]MCB9586184.1 phosphatase PAP2 family protein [Polyangiaceae bacterium]MCB9606861.1 phosphatase PAP2 family protein [Polyangiaceae bacterium]